MKNDIKEIENNIETRKFIETYISEAKKEKQKHENIWRAEFQNRLSLKM